MYDITIVNSGLLMKGISVPIGPLIIASVLRNNGFNVEFRDYQGKKLSRRFDVETFKKFCDNSADILAISATCNSMPIVLGAVELIKKENPDKIIILGGAGPSDLSSELLKYFPVDYVVIGEGEITTLELMKAIKDSKEVSNINGIAYVENGEILVTPQRKRIDNISEIPHPAYDLLNLDDYDRIQTIITARGCPFDCQFCSAHSIWQRKLTHRSVEDIVAEIKSLIDYTNVIAFADDTFVLDRNRVKNIISAVRAEGIDLPWTCNGKITLMDKEWFEFMEKTNCIQVFYGVEAGSDKILKKIHKGHTVEQARNVIKETTNYVRNVRASYIWGYPFETIEDFYDLIETLYEDMNIPGVLSQMSLLSPLPSSPLYKEYGDSLEFSIEAQSRAGGLPVNENIEDYPNTIELILKYPKLFSSFYYYKQDNFDLKLKAIKKVDWIYDAEKVKANGY
ncbi:B12-binding domain-containing radical SAM protein [Clostridium sp. 19966]|uniref:B12-binding domain-containing radical SAM protein n=1 Tax=Clostridium sp. 19966 TaxID=2768166 RepID=UPI0028DE9088|nr:radical SAM protein [Clostridium sp. 19966]MDT8717348.1 B12-binding domain-containing radical SAM protein [Clostridium sp. 19966]